jgi:hypothetical protein
MSMIYLNIKEVDLSEEYELKDTCKFLNPLNNTVYDSC